MLHNGNAEPLSSMVIPVNRRFCRVRLIPLFDADWDVGIITRRRRRGGVITHLKIRHFGMVKNAAFAGVLGDQRSAVVAK